MTVRRVVASVVLTGLVASCGGGGESSEQARNAALEVASAALPFPATNVWPWDIRWSADAQRAVSYSGDSAYEGLFVGQASVVKTSDPDDESVPASFPVSQYGALAGAPDGHGGWYLGGRFLYIDGEGRGKMVHIRANGTLDNAFYLDITPDDTYGYDNSSVNWIAMHPNGSDVLVAVSGATSVGGTQVDRLCNYIYVLDGTTGARKADTEPRAELGCTYSHVVVGNRLIRAGGYGGDAPLLASIDLTTGREDGFLAGFNAKYPYFKTSDTDYRSLSEIEVRGNTLWVFGNLDAADHRIAKVDLTTGRLIDFAASPVTSTSYESWFFDYAVTDTHVMVQVRERGENGSYDNVFHLFDARTGRKTAFNPVIPSISWNWAVNDVTVWKGNFLLTGFLSMVNGRRVRGHVVLDFEGRFAASQLPYAVSNANFEWIDVREFPELDRTFVTFHGTDALYDPYYTGPMLVTDKEGVPQEFRLDAETESRDIVGIGVVGRWLYVSTLGPYVPDRPLWFDSRVDRFDLASGKRDPAFRADVTGTYVYDIYGDDGHLAFLFSDMEGSRISLRSAMNGDENTVTELVADGERMLPGEGTVDGGNLYVRVVPQQGVTAPTVARVELATGRTTYVDGASSPDPMWLRPTMTSVGLMVPMMGHVDVVDPKSMRAVSAIAAENVTDVAEFGGRLVMNSPRPVEVDPRTLAVIGPWGPQGFTATRLVPVGDSAVSGVAQPFRTSANTVISGVFGVKSDGSIVTLRNYRRLGDRPAADSPDVVQVTGPVVHAMPVEDVMREVESQAGPVGAPQVIPPTPAPNATTQRVSERVSIIDVAPGDRSVTVTYRAGSGGGKHTVRVVGGKQSCSTSAGSCTVKGLAAGTQYRFVVVPESEDVQASAESVAVAPWAALRKGSTKKASSLLKPPAKGTATWSVKGAACALKGTSVTAKKKGTCTLTVSVRTKSGTLRVVTDVRVI